MDLPVYPLINGFEYSFASIEVELIGNQGVRLPLPGIKAINYNDKLARAKVFGNSVAPQGRTRGQVTPSGSIEFYRRQWESACNVLSNYGAWGISERAWTIIVLYGEMGITPTRDVLEGVSVINPDASNGEGTDASVIKCELDIMKPILWNGKSRSLSSNTLLTAAGR
jgi:hypothetical protein